MIKFSKLDPFYFYRTKKNIFLTSQGSEPKKGLLISVFAPSIKEEIEYISSISDLFKFRFTDRYLIEKFTVNKLQNAGIKRVNNSDNTDKDEFNPSIMDIEKLFKGMSGTNANQVQKFIVFNDKMKTCPDLKNFNFIYEFNHAHYYLTNNTKDKRIASAQGPEFTDVIISYLTDKLKHEVFSKHTDKVLFIPINLWYDFSEYKKNTTFKSTNKNLLTMVFNHLKTHPELVEKLTGWKLVLTNYNEFMILDIDTYLEDKKKDKPEHGSLGDIFRRFMYLCKSNIGHIEEEPSEDGINGILDVEASSLAHEKATDIIAKSKIDPSTIDKKDIEEVEQVIKEKIKFDGEKVTIDDSEISTQDMDSIIDTLKSKSSGASLENIKRNKMLEEKYKDVKFIGANNNVIDDPSMIINDIEPLKIKAHLANPGLESVTSANVFESYINDMYYKHLLAILKHFGTCDPKMFILDDIKEEDVSDYMNKMYLYTVNFESEDRTRHNMSFYLPKFYQDRYLFLNSAKKDITMQKFPYPITKTADNMTQIVGNDKKIFIERYGQNISPRMTKVTKFLNTVKHTKLKLVKGDSSMDNSPYLVSIEYSELAKNFYLIIFGDYKFIFRIDDAIIEMGPFKGDEKVAKFIPFCRTKDNVFYLDNTTDTVIDKSGRTLGGLSDFIIECIISTDPAMDQKIKEISISSNHMYNRAIVMSFKIPVILLAASLHKDHLVGVLNLAKIKYELSDKRVTIDKSKQGMVKFEDMYLIYDRYPYSNSLLMEGLTEIPTEQFKFDDFSDRETYLDIYGSVYNKRNLLNALDNFNQLFVDPITKQVQERLGGPTDFVSMLLMGSDLLADNTYKLESSYDMSRIRGPEIVLVYLYQELAKAYGNYRMNPKIAKFTIPKDAVIKALMKSQLIDEHSSSNPILEMENDRRIKSKGPVGLNVDQAYTLDKRAYHPTMKGLVALSTTASGEVGITRQLTINANVKDPLGFVEINKDDKDIDGSEMLGIAEMANAFSIESADANRSMMTTGQHKHLIPVDDMSDPLISTDFERVVPFLTKDYARVSKQPGKVLAIENSIMIVEYKDGSREDIDLNDIAYKHTSAGKFHINNLVTDLKVGSKFDTSDILAYDPKHFRKDIFGDVVATTGTLAKVAFIATGESYEDSTYIVNSLGEKMTTRGTKKKDIVVGPYTNIKQYVKRGETVQANSYLLVFDDAEDEFTSSLLSTAAGSTDDDVVHFGSKPVKSKVKGIVKDIKVYYTVPFESLTKSMQKFIKEIASYETSKEETLKKFVELKNATSILSPIQEVKPDSLGRIKGVKVEDGVLIEYYIEYTDVMGVGDKITFSAVKGVINNVIDDDFAAFTESAPDEPIEIFTSIIGVAKRMVLDIFKIAMGSRILVEEKKKFIELFGDEIRRGGN